MKLILVITIMAVPLSLFAQDQNKDRDWIHEKWALKFDQNGDGKLDEQEKQAGDKAVRKWREGHKKKIGKFDKNGDGTLDDAEIRAAKEEHGKQDLKHNHQHLRLKYNELMKKLENGDEELVKKFDKNGDGQINDEEKETAKREIKNFFKGAAEKAKRGNGDQNRRVNERWNTLSVPNTVNDEDTFDGVL